MVCERGRQAASLGCVHCGCDPLRFQAFCRGDLVLPLQRLSARGKCIRFDSKRPQEFDQKFCETCKRETDAAGHSGA